MLEIPIASRSPDFTIRTPLDGVLYALRFTWNMRDGWYVSLSDADSSTIVSAKKLVPNWSLFRLCTDERCPPNVLVLLDTTGAGERPGRYDLGVRHRLLYNGE